MTWALVDPGLTTYFYFVDDPSDPAQHQDESPDRRDISPSRGSRREGPMVSHLAAGQPISGRRAQAKDVGNMAALTPPEPSSLLCCLVLGDDVGGDPAPLRHGDPLGGRPFANGCGVDAGPTGSLLDPLVQ